MKFYLESCFVYTHFELLIFFEIFLSSDHEAGWKIKKEKMIKGSFERELNIVLNPTAIIVILKVFVLLIKFYQFDLHQIFSSLFFIFFFLKS